MQNSTNDNRILVYLQQAHSLQECRYLLEDNHSIELCRSNKGFIEKSSKKFFELYIFDKYTFLEYSSLQTKGSVDPYIKKLVLTDNSDEGHITELVQSGVDDYCILPSTPHIISFKISNILRMIKIADRTKIVKNGVCLKYDESILVINDTKIYLSKFEKFFLKTLIMNEKPISTGELTEIFLKYSGKYYKDNNIRVGVCRLRKKIFTQSGRKPISSHKNTGYFLS